MYFSFLHAQNNMLFPFFSVKYLQKRKFLLIFATTYLPRFPSEQRAQGKFFLYT